MGALGLCKSGFYSIKAAQIENNKALKIISLT